MVKSMTRSPSCRLVSNLTTNLDYERFAKEATMFNFNAVNGTMSSMGAGQNRSRKSKGASAQAIEVQHSPLEGQNQSLAVSSSGHADRGSWKSKKVPKPEEKQEGNEAQHRGTPQPFASQLSLQPVQVSACDTPCGQCGSRGTDGTIYGDAYYCEPCWSRMGLLPAARAAPNGSMQQQLLPEGKPRQRKPKSTCMTCERSTSIGQSDAGNFYCGRCWSAWRGTAAGSGTGFSTDVSTEYTEFDYDSGTDGTIINSDCVTLTDTSDTEWW